MASWLYQIAPYLVLVGGLLSVFGGVLVTIDANRQQAQIQATGKETKDYLLGADSYPLITPSTRNIGGQQYLQFFYIHLNGKNPISDLWVTITDLQAMPEAYAKGQKYMWKYNVGRLATGAEINIAPVPSPSRDKHLYEFNYVGSNGVFVQRSIFIKSQGNWLTGIRLTKNGAVVHEYFSTRDFPEELKAEILR